MKRLSLSVLSVIIVCSAFSGQVARADEGSCTNNDATQSQEVTPKDGLYKIYVKLGMQGQDASVSAYLSVNATCVNLGTSKVNGTTWTQIGESDFSSGQSVNFELASNQLQNNEGSARPQILLLPDNSPCTPNITCDTTKDGQPAYVIPVELTTSSSGISVSQIYTPSSDTIAEVQYYASGELMYKSPTLQPFNYAYASYMDQKVARVVVYTSKQRLVIPSVVPTTYSDTVLNAFLRLNIKHSTLVLSITICLFILLLVLLVRLAANRYERVAYYNHSHGIGKRGPLASVHATIHAIGMNRVFKYIGNSFAALLTMVTIIIVANNLVISPYRVDGNSMQNTLQDNQRIFVNKLPVSLNNQFKPLRGQIVIFRPNYGNLSYSSLRNDGILVKRIIALPGERIVSEKGKLTIYNTDHPNGYSVENTEPWGKRVTIDDSDEPFDITLANDQIFVAGDNRPHSVDSRINGALPLAEVIGVVIGH